MKFPSAAWFEALQERAEAKADLFKKLGFVDANVGIMITPENGGASAGFVLEFSGYGCKRVDEVDRPKDSADFVIEGKYSTWKEMIENIRRNGEADLQHTLNVLTMPGVPLKVEAADQLKADLFFRYNQTLQEFFNGAAEVETEFVE
jgi:hypothetical protein